MSSTAPAGPGGRPSAGGGTGPEYVGLLTQVMTNTLDQDYQVVADRRADAGRLPSKSRTRVGVLVTLLAFGVMVGISAVETARNAPVVQSERNDLIRQIHLREARLDRMHATLTGLQNDVTALQRSGSSAAGTEKALLARAAALAVTTGVAPVTGPGIQVTVDDAPGASASQGGGIVLDTDLQTLTNALWQSGAEAVAINGQRLTSLTAIRTAGRAITVDFHSLTPPYVVEAIGNPNTLAARLLQTPGGQAWESLHANLGIRFDVVSADTLTLPGSSGTRLLHARPVGGR